ncbi:Lar family restriction alleviation protein [Proteus mirabilis]|uniref:Lar family restriction alleviation protein n=2 Tax=Morganellaceae TaxID=1903414 RepID=UPI0034D64634|nr:Lar family restriction alleviation protein [Proteus mirabilis]
MMSELKKCPFCGGRGEYHYFEDLGHLVICSNTICPSNKFGYTDADEAKQAWNRRANSE